MTCCAAVGCGCLGARRLQGKFSQLLQLLASMSFLSGGLAAIMNAYRDALASGTLAVPVGGRRNTLTGGLTPAAARPASSPTKAAAVAAGSGAGGLASRQQQQQQWTAAAAAAALPGVLQEALAAGHGGSSSSSSQLEPPGVEQLLSSLAVAMQELPVWEGEAVEQVSCRPGREGDKWGGGAGCTRQ